MAKTKWVCRKCGSAAVYSDAWVGVNDESDILGPYDDKYCAHCEGECRIEEVPADTPEPATSDD
jgi:hypothetical protein